MTRELFFQIFIPLIAILDPFAIIPYYLATNPSANFSVAKKDARIMSFAALLILVVGGFVGMELLELFGLNMRYFKIAWGLVITYNAFRMAVGMLPAGYRKTGKKMSDIAGRGLIIPLTMPLVAGPGSLAYVIGWFDMGYDVLLPLLCAIVVSCLVYYVTVRYSIYLQRLLWDLWIALITRIMWLLLLAIGVQMILLNI